MGAATSAPANSSTPDHTLEFAVKSTVNTADVITIAETAGKAILNVYNSEQSKWDVEIKSDKSPVTLADREANRVICENLGRLTPHIPIVSEENSIAPYETRQAYQYYWLVDPLDGTKEFLKRNGQFTVNIALIHGSEPVLGVVHVPCQDTTYWGVKGQGAWKKAAGKTARLQAASFTLDTPNLKIVGSRSHKGQYLQEFVDLLVQPEITEAGSSLKLLMVAEGSAHIYPRFAPCCEWDTAAADIVVREAGGVVLQAGTYDLATHAPLQDWKTVLTQEKSLVYNKPELENPWFVVFGRKDAST